MAKPSTTSTSKIEKRGGYGSSSKPAASLVKPPRGPAPGANAKTKKG